MGIQGLLPSIKPVIKQRNISEFSFKRIAIDTYSWIHKATYGSINEIIENKDTLKWINYCLNYIDMLLSYSIEIILVFDGSELPAKFKTEQIRANSRNKNFEAGKKAIQNGELSNGRALLARSIDVTPRMAAQLIRICRKYRPMVKCVVAPYEADAQLSFLSRNNLVDAVISEDSDCIPYQCKEMIFKLDYKTGDCEHLVQNEIFQISNESFDLTSFNSDMITMMCIISGCDYLSSPAGYGMKKSYKLVAKQKTPSRIIKMLKLYDAISLTNCVLLPFNSTSLSSSSSLLSSSSSSENISLCTYEFKFYQAIMTFLHQTIFDVTNRKLSSLTPIPEESQLYPSFMLTHYLSTESIDNIIDMIPTSFLGPFFEDNALACAIADGLVDPTTKLPFNLPENIDTTMIRRLHPDNNNNNNNNNSNNQRNLTSSTTNIISVSNSNTTSTIKVFNSTNYSSQKYTPGKRATSQPIEIDSSQKKLKQFFTPVDSTKLKNSLLNTQTKLITPNDNFPTLNRSATFPNLTTQKDPISINFSSYVSKFQSIESSTINSVVVKSVDKIEEIDIPITDKLVKTKKSRKSYPMLSTKESLQLLSQRKIALARESLLSLENEIEISPPPTTKTKRCEVIVLSDSEGETSDDKFSSSQNLSQTRECYKLSVSPPFTPSKDDNYTGTSMTPVSPSSQLQSGFFQQNSQSDDFYSPPTSPVNNFSQSLLKFKQESEIIEDSDQFTTPLQESKYFKLNHEIHNNSKKSFEGKIKFSQDDDNNNNIIIDIEVNEDNYEDDEGTEIDDIKTSSKTIRTKSITKKNQQEKPKQQKQQKQEQTKKSNSVGIESFKRFQYTCK